MYLLATILILIVSALLILIVLVQESKGGGLASNFSSSNQVMGVKKTTNFLEKATWTLAVALLALSLVASMSIPRAADQEQESAIREQVQNTFDESTVPNYPSRGEEIEVQGREQQPGASSQGAGEAQPQEE